MILASEKEMVIMRAKSQISSLLILLVLLVTFPIWVTVGGVLFGVAAGVFGAIFGVIAALFGVMIGLLVLPFKIIFGGDWGFHDGGLFYARDSTYVIITIILLTVLIMRREQSAN